MAKFKTLSLCQKVLISFVLRAGVGSDCISSWSLLIFLLLHANVQYVYIVYALVSDGFSKRSGTRLFPGTCTIWALTKPLLGSKVLKWLFKTMSFSKIKYGIKILHANVECVFTVYAKYQLASVKPLVKANIPCMHYMGTNKTLIKKQSVKNGYVQKAVILSKVFLWQQTSSCKCSMCLHCVCCGTSLFPRVCTIYAP